MRGDAGDGVAPELVRGQQARRPHALDLERPARLTRQARPDAVRRDEQEGDEASDGDGEPGRGRDDARTPSVPAPDVRDG
jgi:hypothetical protein